MAGAALSEGDDIIAAINITPMVDIILVLLIVFMVTTTLVQNPVVPIKLPRSESAIPRDTTQKTLNIMITKDQKLYIDGYENTKDTVKETLDNAVKENPDTFVILGADQDLEYKYVMEMLELTRVLGVKNLSLNVQSAKTGQGQ